MTNLFVFTAGKKEARDHWMRTVAKPFPRDKVFQGFPELDHGRLEKIESDGDGFYAWGGEPGPKRERCWHAMTRDDVIMGAYGGSYRMVGTILDKFDNEDAAETLWGRDTGTGNTWQFMYFFSKPETVSRRYIDVADYLHRGYRGITQISDDRVARIENDYGSLDSFLERRIIASESGIDRPKPSPEPTPEPEKPTIDDELKRLAGEAARQGEFDATNEEDARERALRSLVIRQGQPAFRRKLLLAYGEQCAITGFDSESALEAAHIIPYRGEHTNDVTNGLLLRADIHSLFDCGKIGIRPDTKEVLLADSLTRSKYKYLAGKKVRLPNDPNNHPSPEALSLHLESHKLR